MANKLGRTSLRMKKLKDEPILGWSRSSCMMGCVYIIAPVECYSGYKYFQWKKTIPVIDAEIKFILILCC